MPHSNVSKHALLSSSSDHVSRIVTALHSPAATPILLRRYYSPPLHLAVARPSGLRCRPLASRYFWTLYRTQEQGARTNTNSANTRDDDAPVLRPIGDTPVEAVTRRVRQQLVDSFLVKIERLDMITARPPLQRWLRLFYEAEPTRCIMLVLPNETARETACQALRKVCKRWDGWVGVFKASYVCLVVSRASFDTLINDLEHDVDVDFKGEVRVHCAIGSKHEMDGITASSGLDFHIDASRGTRGESPRLLLLATAASVSADRNTVEIRSLPNESIATSETTAASSDSFNINLFSGLFASVSPVVECVSCVALAVASTWVLHHVRNAPCEREQRSGSKLEQEHQHGESYNQGKSEQKSALKVGHGDIQAGGDVHISTPTHHGCEANPLSRSSPTVGNNQPNGNEGLDQKN